MKKIKDSICGHTEAWSPDFLCGHHRALKRAARNHWMYLAGAAFVLVSVLLWIIRPKPPHAADAARDADEADAAEATDAAADRET